MKIFQILSIIYFLGTLSPQESGPFVGAEHINLGNFLENGIQGMTGEVKSAVLSKLLPGVKNKLAEIFGEGFIPSLPGPLDLAKCLADFPKLLAAKPDQETVCRKVQGYVQCYMDKQPTGPAFQSVLDGVTDFISAKLRDNGYSNCTLAVKLRPSSSSTPRPLPSPVTLISEGVEFGKFPENGLKEFISGATTPNIQRELDLAKCFGEFPKMLVGKPDQKEVCRKLQGYVQCYGDKQPADLDRVTKAISAKLSASGYSNCTLVVKLRSSSSSIPQPLPSLVTLMSSLAVTTISLGGTR